MSMMDKFYPRITLVVSAKKGFILRAKAACLLRAPGVVDPLYRFNLLTDLNPCNANVPDWSLKSLFLVYIKKKASANNISCKTV